MKRGIFFSIKIILIVLAFGIFVVCLAAIKSDTLASIALSPVEKKFQKKIEFNASHIWLPANISLEGVSITDETGSLYYFDAIDIRYNLANLLFNKKEFSFDLRDIKLYQNVGLLDSVANMLVISTMPDVKFEEIVGVLQLYKNALLIKNVYVHNDKMRIRGSGRIDKNGSLDCDVSFSFSTDITDMMPDAVKVALLKYEGGGWMGIALKVKGNYKTPSLHITSDTLKLNIIEGLLGDE